MTTQAALPPVIDSAPTDVGPQIISRIAWRLIPYLCIVFIVNYLDRTNVAMAKLRMLGDIGISEAVYGFGAGLFFIGYFIFEVPSNLIMERVGARAWMARIMISWGLICSAMMFVRGAWSFYTLRFLLGVAEAGFYPGIVLYLTYWIPSRQRTAVLAALLTSTAVSGVVGNPLAGLIMRMDGIGGLHGWQWLFLIEGVMPVLLGFVTIWILPDKPADARWLSQEQRQWLAMQLARDDHECPDHVAVLASALRDARLWLLSWLYFMLIMGLYGFIYWVPAIIKSLTSDASDLHIGMLSAIPYLVAAVTMVVIARHADRHNERRWHVVVTTLIAAIGVCIVIRCHTTATVMPALCIAAIGIWGSLAPFWALSTRFLRGTAAAGGIAIVNSVGCLSGFVAPSVIGWVKTSSGGFKGLYVVAAALVCGSVLVLCVPRSVDRGKT